jgi:hypothetical protein
MPLSSKKYDLLHACSVDRVVNSINNGACTSDDYLKDVVISQVTKKPMLQLHIFCSAHVAMIEQG